MPKARERRLREARSGCPGDGVARKDHPSRKGGGTEHGVDDDCSSGPARRCGGEVGCAVGRTSRREAAACRRGRQEARRRGERMRLVGLRSPGSAEGRPNSLSGTPGAWHSRAAAGGR